MRLGELDERRIAAALAGPGLTVVTPPVVLRVRSPVRALAGQMQLLYADYEAGDGGFADVELHIGRSRGLRRYLRPQSRLYADGVETFDPSPLRDALPMVEWGFNYHFATRIHRYLLLHCAVVARDDRAILFPAWPGSGKTTLAAGLAARGYRLLSDEFGLVHLDTGELVPFPRPLPLKNESIDIIRSFAADAVLGPTFMNTRKGNVAHMRPPAASVAGARRSARPASIVFPAFERGRGVELVDIDKPAAFMKLAGNSFNYEVLGASAFTAVSRLVRGCDCRILRFGRLDQAVERLESLQ